MLLAGDRAAAIASRHIPLIDRDLREAVAECGVSACGYWRHRRRIDSLLDDRLEASRVAESERTP